MSVISKTTQNLIEQYRSWHEQREKKETTTIHVDEVASRVAVFYEKVRGIVDWREEHLMKRAAIARNLKRRLILAKEGKAVAEPLVLELIRGGHFPNEQIEERKIAEAEKILDKYIYILQNSKTDDPEKQKLQLYNWLLGIAACEIEEALSPFNKERALIEYMTESMINKIVIQPRGVISISKTETSEDEKIIQTYIACQRALFKLDAPIITYHLLKKGYASWSNLSDNLLSEIAQNIYSIWDSLEKELNHPLKDKFYNICERYDTPYLLLGDILTEKSPIEIQSKISQPENLEIWIRDAYQKRLSTLKGRLNRAAIYSTLSIFLTNSVSLILVEIPLAKMLTGVFLPITIAVDILGPTLLMFFLVATIKPPSKNNLEIVLLEIMKIVYETDKTDQYEIRAARKTNWFLKLFIFLLYLAGASISLGIMAMIFRSASFPPTSILINIVFVALIAFAGLAVRNRAEELTVEERKTGFFDFIFDILFLPVVGLGRWLSNKWKKYNAIAVFFSALIDLPFQVFIEFLEQWRYFLKEKKEEIH